MAKLDLALVVRTVDQATGPLRRIQKSVRDVGRQVGLSRIGRQAGAVGRQMKRVGQEAGKFARRFGLISAAVGGAAFLFGQKYANAADTVAKTADRIGVGVEKLQELRHAFDIGGVSAGQTDKALGFFAKAIGEAATGIGEAKPVFEAMGIEIFDQAGKLRPMSDLLDDVADAMAKQEDPSKKAYAATKLFGRAGMGLINTLDDGSKALREVGAEVHEYGVITDEEARLAEKYIDAQARLKGTLTGLANAIGAELIPKLTPLVDKTREWIKENKPLLKQIAAFVTDVDNLKVAAIALATILGAKLILSMVALGGQLVALAALLLANPIVLIVAALAGAAALIYANWDGIVQYFKDIWQGIEDAFDDPFAAAVAAFADAWTAVDDAWSGAGQYFKDIWQGIEDAFDDPFAAAVAAFADAWTAVDDAWSGAGQYFKDIWQGIEDAFDFDGLAAWLGTISLFDMLTAPIRGIVAYYQGVWNLLVAVFDILGWTETLRSYAPEIYAAVAGWLSGIPEFFARQWQAIKDVFDFQWLDKAASAISGIFGDGEQARSAARGPGPDIIDFFGGPGASPAGAGPPSLFAPSAAAGGGAGGGESAGKANITVDFRNMPRGTRTETRADSDVDLEVTNGYVMAGGA